MIRNYIIITFRNLRNHKVFSFINMLGLSVGITCCVLLALYIQSEFSYEQHFTEHKNICRVTSTIITADKTLHVPSSSPPVAMTMAREFPEVVNATRVVTQQLADKEFLIRYNEDTYFEQTAYLVDSTFFDVFSYAFEAGNRHTALRDPATVVLSHRTAQKIFGDASPLDELLIIHGGYVADTFRVAGVLAPFESPSQLDAGFYMTMQSGQLGYAINSMTTWAGNNLVISFIQLAPNADVTALEDKLPALLEKYGTEDLQLAGFQKSLHLQPLDDMHLYSKEKFSADFLDMDIGTHGNIQSIYILGSICFFILLIACINFTNLTTAKAAQRAAEVGIRKSLGASRIHLIRQFLGESITLVMLAMILSIGMAQLALPLFNLFTGRHLSIGQHNLGYITLALLGISLLTGVLAGSYPALYLSGFQPIRILKNKHLSGDGGLLRKGLVVFQFIISITLISAIVIIQQQLSYMQQQPLGFNPRHRISIPLRTTEAKTHYKPLKDRLRQLAGVQDVAATNTLPASAIVPNDMLLYTQGNIRENALLHHCLSDFVPGIIWVVYLYGRA